MSININLRIVFYFLIITFIIFCVLLPLSSFLTVATAAEPILVDIATKKEVYTVVLNSFQKDYSHINFSSVTFEQVYPFIENLMDKQIIFDTITKHFQTFVAKQNSWNVPSIITITIFTSFAILVIYSLIMGCHTEPMAQPPAPPLSPASQEKVLDEAMEALKANEVASGDRYAQGNSNKVLDKALQDIDSKPVVDIDMSLPEVPIKTISENTSILTKDEWTDIVGGKMAEILSKNPTREVFEILQVKSFQIGKELGSSKEPITEKLVTQTVNKHCPNFSVIEYDVYSVLFYDFIPFFVLLLLALSFYIYWYLKK